MADDKGLLGKIFGKKDTKKEVDEAAQKAAQEAKREAEIAAENAKRVADAERYKAEAEARKIAAEAEAKAKEVAEENAKRVEQAERYKAEAEARRVAAEAAAAAKAKEAAAWIGEHTVTAEDTLSHIALKFYGHATPPYYKLIYEANKEVIGDNMNIVVPGQVLRIPALPEDLK